MKQQIEVLARLAGVRSGQVRQMLGRVAYQRRLCDNYRNNIASLNRLCGFSAEMATTVQRDNQQRYKSTLYKMMDLQRRELATAEATLARVERELQAMMRAEKIVTTAMDARLAEWNKQLAQQEQKLQDGLAAQAWWRCQAS